MIHSRAIRRRNQRGETKEADETISEDQRMKSSDHCSKIEKKRRKFLSSSSPKANYQNGFRRIMKKSTYKTAIKYIVEVILILKYRLRVRPPSLDNIDGERPSILFVSIFDFMLANMFNSELARLLQRQGAQVTVLLQRNQYALLDRILNWQIRKIYSPLKNIDFVYIDDLLDFMPDGLEGNLTDWLGQLDDLNTAASLEHEGFEIGKSAYAMALRRLRKGSLDSENIDDFETIREILVMALRTHIALKDFLSDRSFSTAIMLERGYTPAGEIFNLCRHFGVDVVQWTGSPFQGKVVFKRFLQNSKDVHPLSLSPTTVSVLNEMPEGQRVELAVRGRKLIEAYFFDPRSYYSSQVQMSRVVDSDYLRNYYKLSAEKKIGIIFSHVLYDAVTFYGNSLFRNYEDWLVTTVDAAIKNESVQWLVKLHPANLFKSRLEGFRYDSFEEEILVENFGALPEHVKLIPASAPFRNISFFDLVDFGVTVRGSVGFELPCFGKPVIVAGSSRFSGLDFCLESESVSAYLEILDNASGVSNLTDRQTLSALVHAAVLLHQRLIDSSLIFPIGNAPTTARGLWKHMKLNPRAGKTSVMDGSLEADMRAELLNFILASSSEDFLSPSVGLSPM